MAKGFAKKPLPSIRRLARVVADEHGNASIEWFDAPPDYQCPTVELKSLGGGLSLEPEKAQEPEVAYDPYSNSTDGTQKRATRRRTNLRQLSEWIKTVREVNKAKDADSRDD